MSWYGHGEKGHQHYCKKDDPEHDPDDAHGTPPAAAVLHLSEQPRSIYVVLGLAHRAGRELFFEAVAVDCTMPDAHRYRCRNDPLPIGLTAQLCLPVSSRSEEVIGLGVRWDRPLAGYRKPQGPLVNDRFSDRLNRGQRVIYRAAYLPEREFLLASEMRLLDATVQPQHENYRRELETSLRGHGDDHLTSVVVMPLDVAGLLAFAEAEGKDPTRRQTRMDYNMSLSEAGRAVAWPPPRNGSCWCGSGRKYKQCCGAPEFWSATIPDPASLILKVELVGVDPPVWRRLAVPSHLRADRLHLLIQDVMGWLNQHSYEFANDEITLVDPGSASGLVPADAERVISLACEPGQVFSYVYDLGDCWTHTITLEQIRAGDGDNQPAYLDGRGACPPEDCGGPAGYRRLLAAFDSPNDPRHEEATDWLGANFDAAAARPG